MKIEYIIVQAGGKGTRLGYLTANKPKALVPINNLPMLFHLFRQFPDSKFVIIADYKADVMHRYLSVFADVQYLIVNACGQGTCAGIDEALKKIPREEPFMLIWSDLVLSETFSFPEEEGDYVGLSNGFSCRWRYQEDRFEEIPSSETGVAGLFLFKSKEAVRGVPAEGEFVRWLQQEEKKFRIISLKQTEEFGLLSRIEEQNFGRPEFQCRSFNKIEKTDDGKLIKSGIDEQGRELAVREKVWYQSVKERGFTNIPRIYSYEPFVMQAVNGKNIFEYQLDKWQQKEILKKLIRCLRELHSLEKMPADYFSIYDAYIRKTWKRLNQVRDLIPFADRESIMVNGRECRNVFFHKSELENWFTHYDCKCFVLLHGDNTFSNMMLDSDMEPVLIDPRGYFGKTEIYGDPAYDWAKLYYSIVGNYDQFNRKQFVLTIGKNDVHLDIHSNGWEQTEEEFFHLLEGEADRDSIRMIHAIIWLSLTTYTWEDYDSVCGAFYNGIYYLEEVLY